MFPKLGPLPDPETLLIIGAISALVGIGTFILWDQARFIGAQVETPEPFATISEGINRVITGEARAA